MDFPQLGENLWRPFLFHTSNPPHENQISHHHPHAAAYAAWHVRSHARGHRDLRGWLHQNPVLVLPRRSLVPGIRVRGSHRRGSAQPLPKERHRLPPLMKQLSRRQKNASLQDPRRKRRAVGNGHLLHSTALVSRSLVSCVSPACSPTPKPEK
jgi:hypothetical protein